MTDQLREKFEKWADAAGIRGARSKDEYATGWARMAFEAGWKAASEITPPQYGPAELTEEEKIYEIKLRIAHKATSELLTRAETAEAKLAAIEAEKEHWARRIATSVRTDYQAVLAILNDDPREKK